MGAHLGREGVIVADAKLFHSDSVILIDDGNSAVRKELSESVAGIEVLPPTGQVVQRQQHLRTSLFQPPPPPPDALSPPFPKLMHFKPGVGKAQSRHDLGTTSKTLLPRKVICPDEDF